MAAVKVKLGNDAQGISGSIKEWSLRSFAYLQSKIRDAFPALKDKHFHLSWHDSYPDSFMKLSRSPITVADNDDLTYVMNYLQNSTSTPKPVAFFSVIDVSGDTTSLENENVIEKLEKEVNVLKCTIKQLTSDMEGVKKNQQQHDSVNDKEQENPSEQPTDIADLLFEVSSLREENADLVESLAAAKNSVKSLQHELSEYMSWHEESCIELDTLKCMQMGKMDNRMLKEWRHLREIDEQSADEHQSSEHIPQSDVIVSQSDVAGGSELNETTEPVSIGAIAMATAPQDGQLVGLLDFYLSSEWASGEWLSKRSDCAVESVNEVAEAAATYSVQEESLTEDSEVYE